MDFFNSERATQIRESIRYWNGILFDVQKRKEKITENAGAFFEKTEAERASFEQSRLSAPIPEGMGEESVAFLKKMRAEANEIASAATKEGLRIMEEYKDQVLSILDEEERLTRDILTKEIYQIGLAFDVMEITMTEGLSGAVKILTDGGYSKEEATAIATELYENKYKK